MKLTDLKPNEVIHCKTKEEAVRICGIMYAAGLRPGSFFTDNWDVHEENTCYDLRSDEAGHVALYVQDNYTIHPSELFQDSDSSDEITEDGLMARGFVKAARYAWQNKQDSTFAFNKGVVLDIVVVNLGFVHLNAIELPAVKTLTDIDHLIRLLGL